MVVVTVSVLENVQIVSSTVQISCKLALESVLAGSFEAGKFVAAEVVDPRTVRVRFEAPWAPARAYLAFEVGIWPKTVIDVLRKDQEAFDGEKATGLVGSGPYRMKEYRSGEFARLEPVGDAEPITVRVVEDPGATLLDMQKGVTDAVYAEPDRQSAFKAIPDVQLRTYQYHEPITLAVGSAVDLTLRRAILLGVDAEDLRLNAAAPAKDKVPAGVGTSPGGGRLFLGTQAGFNHPECAKFSPGFDPITANALLDAAGYAVRDGQRVVPQTGQRLTLRLVYHKGIPEYTRVAERAADQLGKTLRIRVELLEQPNETDFQKFLAGSADTWEIFLAEWPFRARSDPSLLQSVSSKSVPPTGRNFPRYTSPKLEELIRRADTVTDLAARQKLYHEVHKELAAGYVFKTLYAVEDAWVFSGRVLIGDDPNAKWTLERMPDTIRLKR